MHWKAGRVFLGLFIGFLLSLSLFVWQGNKQFPALYAAILIAAGTYLYGVPLAAMLVDAEEKWTMVTTERLLLSLCFGFLLSTIGIWAVILTAPTQWEVPLASRLFLTLLFSGGFFTGITRKWFPPETKNSSPAA